MSHALSLISAARQWRVVADETTIPAARALYVRTAAALISQAVTGTPVCSCCLAPRHAPHSGGRK